MIYKSAATKFPAPYLASFSSRGPQYINRNILKVINFYSCYSLVLFPFQLSSKMSTFYVKPDLAAPGVDILAAYSKLTSVTGYPEDTRYNVFNIISGTSMACPHATAAAAYVKSFHPDWTPAAIKSALMTTGKAIVVASAVFDNINNHEVTVFHNYDKFSKYTTKFSFSNLTFFFDSATPIKVKANDDSFAELGIGSGQISPGKALNPGLVYDIRMNSYIAFLCKEGYNSTDIGILIGIKSFNCSGVKPATGTDGINYPTMHIQLLSASSDISAVFYRTVKNVGYGASTYKAKVTAPKGLSVEVIPNTLTFTQLRQELSFKVVLKGPPMPTETLTLSALLEWNDSKHNVRSPIVVVRPSL